MPFICNHLQEEHCFDTRNAVSLSLLLLLSTDSSLLRSHSDQSRCRINIINFSWYICINNHDIVGNRFSI
uniref:Uncharacterized protein n=1 Tax=Arundo donax TaxID=35708 RepID=A0A0A9EUM7_ARUDO